jgi:hypothetical protein
MSRVKARQARAAQIAGMRRKTTISRGRILGVMAKAREIVIDKRFRRALAAQGIDNIPNFAIKARLNLKTDKGCKENRPRGTKNDYSLEFLFLWGFFFPLLAKPEIAGLLEELWLGFIGELKDGFITLVMDGPFDEVLPVGRSPREFLVHC